MPGVTPMSLRAAYIHLLPASLVFRLTLIPIDSYCSRMNPTVNQDGEEIRRLRKERLDLSVPAFAARIGIRPQSLSNIELGNKPAGLGTLLRISRALGVPMEQILKEDADRADGEPETAGAAA